MMMSDTPIELGPWVEIQTERCRGGRSTVLAVNRRDGNALLLDTLEREQIANGDDIDPQLAEALAAGGFLATVPAPAPAPRSGRVARFLRVFDIRWHGADRYIHALHDRGLRHAWRPQVLALQAFVAIVGVVALIAALRSDRPLELRPSPWEVPVYLVLSMMAIAVHELAHGLVVAHHGRKVAAVGFRLHLGSPAFYVESVEALLLTRRQRLTQAAAGPWTEWLFVSVIAVILWFAPIGALTPVVHRFVVLTAFTIATNLLPFAGLDGSLLLADLIREPNLVADSKDALRRLGSEPHRGDRLLVAYGVLNTIVSASLLLTGIWFWYILFGGLLGMLAGSGPLGLLGAVAVLAVSFGPAVAGVVPHLRRWVPLDRMVFRLERRCRVRFAEQFATFGPFANLDERALGILAGQLTLRRVRRSNPLHEPGFIGYVAHSGSLEFGSERNSDHPHIATVNGPGISATTRRWLSPIHVGLLPSSSLSLLGIFDDGPVLASSARSSATT
jgi:hypothetical protein